MLTLPKSGVPDADMCIIFEITLLLSVVFDMAIVLIMSLLIQTRNSAASGGPLLALRVWRGDDFYKLSAEKKILKIGQKLTESEPKDWFDPLTAFNP